MRRARAHQMAHYRGRRSGSFGLVVLGREVPTWALVTGVGLLGFILFGRKVMGAGLLGKAFDWGKTQAFTLALPAAVARWAPQILSAARTFGVDPWVLAGIMYRESLGGTALTPKDDPTGTGDFVPRFSGAYAKYANPATGLPPDGKGWGRGLMQIDFGVHNAWVTSHNWADPQVSLNKAAEIFKANLDYFAKQPSTPGVSVECWRINTGMPQIGVLPWAQKYGLSLACAPGAKYATRVLTDPRPLKGALLYEAAAAAYNAGTSGVLQAIAAGLPAEAPTAGQDYTAWLLSKIGNWSRGF